jgi:hypothetical protein
MVPAALALTTVLLRLRTACAARTAACCVCSRSSLLPLGGCPDSLDGGMQMANYAQVYLKLTNFLAQVDAASRCFAPDECVSARHLHCLMCAVLQVSLTMACCMRMWCVLHAVLSPC